jgi:hypothetical protein
MKTIKENCQRLNCLSNEKPEWTTPALTELSLQEWEQMKSGPGEWKDVTPVTLTDPPQLEDIER